MPSLEQQDILQPRCMCSQWGPRQLHNRPVAQEASLALLQERSSTAAASPQGCAMGLQVSLFAMRLRFVYDRRLIID